MLAGKIVLFVKFWQNKGTYIQIAALGSGSTDPGFKGFNPGTHCENKLLKYFP